MAFGTQGAAQKQRRYSRLALSVFFTLVAGCVVAQGTPTAGADDAGIVAVTPPDVAPPELAKISPRCDAPFKDIATPSALPELTEALARKTAIRVLTVGSSSTVGVGSSSPSHNYPNLLSGILKKNFAGLNLTMVNKGVSGEVSAQTAERMRRLVALEKPTLVLWQLGTNDALARVPVDAFKETVRDTVQWLKSHQIDIVLVGLQYTPHVVRDEHYHAIRKALSEVAQEEQVLLVRRFAAMEFLSKVKGQPLLAQDELHLNDLGYQCMAEHIARAMVVSSFVRVKRRPNFGQ